MMEVIVGVTLTAGFGGLAALIKILMDILSELRVVVALAKKHDEDIDSLDGRVDRLELQVALNGAN